MPPFYFENLKSVSIKAYATSRSGNFVTLPE